MGVRRVVPDLITDRANETRDFYVDLFGFELAMDMGWVSTLVSPSNPTAQVTILSVDRTADRPNLTIEVNDIEAVHSLAVKKGLDIVYPLTEEEWGVRRFFVTDPDGAVVNVMTHSRA